MSRRVVLAVLLAGGVLAGCSSGQSGDSTSAVAGSDVAAAVGQQPAEPGESTGQAAQPAATGSITGRQVVRTASLDLSVADVPAAEARVRQIGGASGGYLGDESAADERATLTLRVPVRKLDTVLDELAGLGRVTDRKQNAQDVTDQVIDVTSRIATQKASVARIRALLGKATSISDISQVEGELTKREADLESLEQRSDALAGQTALSTVTVSLAKSAAAPPAAAAAPGGFLGGLLGGWHALVAVGGALAVVFGALLPFAPVIVALALGGIHLLRRRRAKAAPSAS